MAMGLILPAVPALYIYIYIYIYIYTPLKYSGFTKRNTCVGSARPSRFRCLPLAERYGTRTPVGTRDFVLHLPVQTVPGTPHNRDPTTCTWTISWGEKRLGCGFEHPPASNVEVQIEECYTFTPLLRYLWHVMEWPLSLLLLLPSPLLLLLPLPLLLYYLYP